MSDDVLAPEREPTLLSAPKKPTHDLIIDANRWGIQDVSLPLVFRGAQLRFEDPDGAAPVPFESLRSRRRTPSSFGSASRTYWGSDDYPPRLRAGDRAEESGRYSSHGSRMNRRNFRPSSETSGE